MQYEKEIRDSYNDPTTVSAVSARPVVQMHVQDSESGDLSAWAEYSPKQARSLARALKRAANVAEGKPAKKPKPAVIIDGDGDDWHLSPNGKYSLYAPDEDAERNRAYIRLVYGIREERA